MVQLYRYFRNHKWLLYTIIAVSFGLFLALGLQCEFEENIARLLPPTGDNMTIDLAFSDLKVKDKVFIQAFERESTDEVDTENLANAMDRFMQLLEEADDKHHNIAGTFYEIDPTLLMEVGQYLITQAPAYLDFTDEEMDSLTSADHISAQIGQYIDLLDTEMGENLYDILAADPAGIVMSKVNKFTANGSNTETDEESDTQFSAFQHNHIFSADGTVCEGFITPNLSSMDSGTASQLLRSIKKAKKQTEQEFDNVEILYHGTVIQSANNAGRIRADLLYTIGIALIIIIILLGICFKQPSTNILVLLPIVYGGVFALAAIWVIQGGMSIMALGIGAVVLGVALSYCLHVMVHFKYLGNASQTVKEQAKPVMLGSLTTIGAFAGLLFTDSSLLSDFGLFALLAMIGTTVASLVFMPHFFPRVNKRNEKAFAFLERINSAEIDKKNWVLILMVIFLLITIPFSGKVEFDSNLRHINYTAPDVQRAMQQWADKNNHGYFRQYYASVDDDLDGALANLRIIESTCDSLREAGTISRYSKTSALLPDIATQQERIDHWKTYFSEKRSREVWHNVVVACQRNDIDPAMFWPFREMMQADYEPELIVQTGLLPDEIMSNLVEQVDDKWLVFMPVLMTSDNSQIVSDDLTKVTGCMVLDPFYYTIDTVAMMNEDFNTILGISALFVLIVLLLSMRRVTTALISFMPMALSWYVVLGAMYLTGQQFNLINIVVSSFIFGIGVDYSIFIMDGLIAQAKGENTKLLAYHKTAITLSATVLIICMFSLLFAVHPAIKSIGFASLVGMITTMMLSYTLQPWLFRQAMKSKWLRKRILNK